MRIPCPHCGRPARIRTSREMTPLTREAYVQCRNVACCCVFRVLVEAVGIVSPSIAPNPGILLPLDPAAPQQPELFPRHEPGHP